MSKTEALDTVSFVDDFKSGILLQGPLDCDLFRHHKICL
jgi:hypothetical protein